MALRKLHPSTQARFVAFLDRLREEANGNRELSFPPGSTMLAWRKGRHRLTRRRAMDVLLAAGSNWAAFDRSGRLPLQASSLPVAASIAWRLATRLEGQEASVAAKATKDTNWVVSTRNLVIVVGADEWVQTFRNSERVMEGPYCASLEEEVLRLANMTVRSGLLRESRAGVQMSRLQKRLLQLHAA